MENIILESGPCGCFQIAHVFLTQSTRFVLLWSIYFMMFGNFDPGWRCVSPYYYYNEGQAVTGTGTSIAAINGTNLGGVSEFIDSGDRISTRTKDLDDAGLTTLISKRNQTHTTEGLLQIHNVNGSTTITVHPTTSSSSSFYSHECTVEYKNCTRVEFNPTSSTIVTEFGLICDKTWILSLMLFLQYAGMILGSLMWGQIGEWYGRRISVYGATFLLAISNFLALFSPNWQVYTLFTVLIGVAGVGILTCVPVYSMEFLSSKWRGIFASLPVWNASACLFAGAVLWLKDWRHLHILIAIITGVSCLGYFWVPESIRWLAVHGDKEKAVGVVAKIARYNRKPTPNLDAIEKLVEGERGGRDQSQKKYSYLDIARSRPVLFIVLKLSLGLIIAICSYNVLGFGVYSLPGNFYTNFIVSSCSEIPGVLSVGFLANKIGRRWSGLVFGVLQIVSFCSIVACKLLVEDKLLNETLVRVFAFVARGSVIPIICLISPLAVELLPTVVRSIGLGLVLTASRAGGLIAPFLLPRGNTSFLVCFSVLAVAAGVTSAIFLSLPETNKTPLKDTMQELKNSSSKHFNSIPSEITGDDSGDSLDIDNTNSKCNGLAVTDLSKDKQSVVENCSDSTKV